MSRSFWIEHVEAHGGSLRVRGLLSSEDSSGAAMAAGEELELDVTWEAEDPLLPGRAYELRPDALEDGAYELRTPYGDARLGCGRVRSRAPRPRELFRQALLVDKEARVAQRGHRPAVLWLTGLSGAGKSTLANALERDLHARGVHTYLLDGDNIRLGLNADLGFSDADRVENIRRVGQVARLFVDAGLLVLCAFISPFREGRRRARSLVGPDEFFEIFVDTPLEVCAARDPKLLYARAKEGKVTSLTGVGSRYETPEAPEIVVRTHESGVPAAVESIVAMLRSRGVLR